MFPGMFQFTHLYVFLLLSVTYVDSVTDLTATPDSSDSTTIEVSWVSPPHPLPSCDLPIKFTVHYKLINRGQCEVIVNRAGVNFTITSDVSAIVTGLEAHSTYHIYVTSSVGVINGKSEMEIATTIDDGKYTVFKELYREVYNLIILYPDNLRLNKIRKPHPRPT